MSHTKSPQLTEAAPWVVVLSWELLEAAVTPSCKPVEPREGEPGNPIKPILGTIRDYYGPNIRASWEDLAQLPWTLVAYMRFGIYPSLEHHSDAASRKT